MNIRHRILSLVGLLALPPLAAANDNNWQQHEDREHHSKEELSTRDRRNFEAYLDAHSETAQLLYQQPELINDRHQWIEKVEGASVACWWIPVGHRPTITESAERLRLINKAGPTPEAFTLRKAFPPPR